MAQTGVARTAMAQTRGCVTAAGAAFPPDLVLSPTSRWPTTLPDETVRAVLRRPVPAGRPPAVQAMRSRPRASIVVVTYGNLVYNRLCLESVLANTHGVEYELVVVDNGSPDETPAYLRVLARLHPQVRVHCNARNLGFAAASNQGLAAATGEVLVLLNNDTIVPPGWLARLDRHLEDPAVGLVGPVTNRTGNEAQIETGYRTYGELLAFARAHQDTHDGERFDIRMVAMFCAALRRQTFEHVGPLDERFGIGLFEDDDYALRVRAAGYRVVCAEDTFVHHFGQASIGQLAASGAYGALFEANRRRFEAKWGVTWQPHQRRPNQAYGELADRIRAVARAALPTGATVLVVSKGDDDLLDLGGPRGWHFPQANDGTYAGYYPADSAAAIAHLEAMRAKGAEFLLFPSTALWWLEHYRGFREHLEARHELAVAQSETCYVFALKASGTGAGGTVAEQRQGEVRP